MVLTRSTANSQAANDKTRGAPNPSRPAAINNPNRSTRQNSPPSRHDPNLVQLDQLAPDMRAAVEVIIGSHTAPQGTRAGAKNHTIANRRLSQEEGDAASFECRPKSPQEGDSKKLPSDLPSLITIPPQLVIALSAEEVQCLSMKKLHSHPSH